MSVAGILSSAVFSIGSQLLQSRKQQISQEFQQLGTDLKSGNLTAAQADFAALQKLQPSGSSSTSSSNPITQDFNQLAAAAVIAAIAVVMMVVVGLSSLALVVLLQLGEVLLGGGGVAGLQIGSELVEILRDRIAAWRGRTGGRLRLHLLQSGEVGLGSREIPRLQVGSELLEFLSPPLDCNSGYHRSQRSPP